MAKGTGPQEGWAKAGQGAAQPLSGCPGFHGVCGEWTLGVGFLVSGDVALATRPLASQSI